LGVGNRLEPWHGGFVKNIIRCALALILSWTPGFGAEEVVVVPLRGEVSQAQFFFLRRALKDAEKSGAKLVLIDMDTYGGELKASVNMQDALSKSGVETATFVNKNAGSAGALIAVSTKRIYMAPVSAIGAAAPVMGGGQQMSETMSDKVVSYFSGYFRSAAERNGHNPDIAEAFINKTKEVKIGEEKIHAPGSILTLSAQEAVRVVGGKPLLAVAVAEDVGTVAELEFRGAKVRRIEPSGFEQIAFWLTSLAPILLLAGIAAGYIEIKTPGLGVPGVLAGVCFVLFFAGHYIAGLAGREVIVLFALGVVLVVAELVFLNGFILPGVLGVLLMIGSLFYAMVDRYPQQSWIPSMEEVIRPIVNMGIAGVLGVVVITLLARVLPKTPLYGHLVLAAEENFGSAVKHALHVGDEGVALSTLRPVGRAEFGGVVCDVISEGDFVESGSRVRVVAVNGTESHVERVG